MDKEKMEKIAKTLERVFGLYYDSLQGKKIPQEWKFILHSFDYRFCCLVYLWERGDKQELELRIFNGSIDGIMNSEGKINELCSDLNMKIILSVGTLHGRRNVIYSSSWDYWNRNYFREGVKKL